jgi:hypothetical protein
VFTISVQRNGTGDVPTDVSIYTPLQHLQHCPPDERSDQEFGLDITGSGGMGVQLSDTCWPKHIELIVLPEVRPAY